MALEDPFGYRFVRISLIFLNCFILIRIASFLLKFFYHFDPMFILVTIMIASNFMIAIIGAICEHRVSVLVTGSITFLMFLSFLFTNNGKNYLNVSLFTLLAIAAQSLIFSEMLKERQLFSRRNLNILQTVDNNQTGNSPLAAVVIYQSPNSNRQTSNNIFVVDSLYPGAELPKDPPPTYGVAILPPPKYEDVVKMSETNNVSNTATTDLTNQSQQTNVPSTSTSSVVQQSSQNVQNNNNNNPSSSSNTDNNNNTNNNNNNDNNNSESNSVSNQS